MNKDEVQSASAKVQAVGRVLEESGVQEGDTVRIEDTKIILSKNADAAAVEKGAAEDKGEESAEKDAEAAVCWEDCDFETAITATGYGKYNMMILAVSVFPMLSCLSTTSTMSFILPSAECDLDLASFHKGMLNACVYVGCILSGFMWGFLSDTLGRQKLLVITFALDAIFNLTAALSQNFEVLLFAKLLAGFIASGPFAILMTYLAECHSATHRASIMQWTGVFSALGTVALPLLAWVIIPRPWAYTVLGLYLPSWRIFLLVCTLPSVISAVIMYFQHESPKFLMTQGRTDEAMAAFQTIYAINSGQPKSTFPVKSLLNEKKLREKLQDIVAVEKEGGKSLKQFLSDGWKQVSPLFHSPHLRNALLVFSFNAFSLFGLCIRLWMPQLFSSILKLEEQAANATSVCELLSAAGEQVDAVAEPLQCSERVIDGQVYINSIIIGVVTAVSYMVAGYLVKALGKKWLMIGCNTISALACCSMYWGTSSNLLLVMSSLLVAFMSVSTTAIVSVVVDLFPTTLRTVAVSMTMMVGRGGAMFGNLLFPVLLDWDCTVPFFLYASIISCAAFITLGIPKTKGKALE